MKARAAWRSGEIFEQDFCHARAIHQTRDEATTGGLSSGRFAVVRGCVGAVGHGVSLGDGSRRREDSKAVGWEIEAQLRNMDYKAIVKRLEEKETGRREE